jgi:NADPH-dependent ferric siderophore reductase
MSNLLSVAAGAAGSVSPVAATSAVAQGATVAGQFRFYHARVARTRRLGPTMLRITFTGPDLTSFAGGGRDQSCSLFLPHPGQSAPVIPTGAGDGWFALWRAMDPEVRAVMRSYTIREQRPAQAEVDIDFALHGETGPASRWAARARPGDPVVVLGPAVEENRSVGFRPHGDTDWVLLAADETALPAVGGILAWLPAGARARVWIEVPYAGDVQELATAADVEITWLLRGGGPAGVRLPAAVRAAHLPPGKPYAWAAGEAGSVRALRRHLLNERGFDRRRTSFSGYWRHGLMEEQLRAEASVGDDSVDER